MKINLQKFIASSGICSRRKAGDLIKQGRVMVNGKLAELGMRADESDKVEVGGKVLNLAGNKIYIKVNKPVGYTCTNQKFSGEKNIFELVDLKSSAEESARLFIVGRLDKDSRGLVLLTNDGEMAQWLAHPSFEHEKKYEVRIKNRGEGIMNGREAEEIIRKFKNGVDIGKDISEIARAKDVKYLGDNKFLVVLTTGKKRQIRRMFYSLGYDVEDLLRTGIGNLELGNLKEGEWEYVVDIF